MDDLAGQRGLPDRPEARVIGEQRDHVGVLDRVLGVGQDDIAKRAELARHVAACGSTASTFTSGSAAATCRTISTAGAHA
jgi:hypothetical protein